MGRAGRRAEARIYPAMIAGTVAASLSPPAGLSVLDPAASACFVPIRCTFCPEKIRFATWLFARANGQANASGPSTCPAAQPSNTDRQLAAMILPTSSDAKKLIQLAERMGIPTEDAVRRVLQHLTDQQLSQDVVRAGHSVPRTNSWTATSGEGSLIPCGRGDGVNVMDETENPVLTPSEVVNGDSLTKPGGARPPPSIPTDRADRSEQRAQRQPSHQGSTE